MLEEWSNKVVRDQPLISLFCGAGTVTDFVLYLIHALCCHQTNCKRNYIIFF